MGGNKKKSKANNNNKKQATANEKNAKNDSSVLGKAASDQTGAGAKGKKTEEKTAPAASPVVKNNNNKNNNNKNKKKASPPSPSPSPPPVAPKKKLHAAIEKKAGARRANKTTRGHNRSRVSSSEEDDSDTSFSDDSRSSDSDEARTPTRDPDDDEDEYDEEEDRETTKSILDGMEKLLARARDLRSTWNECSGAPIGLFHESKELKQKVLSSIAYAHATLLNSALSTMVDEIPVDDVEREGTEFDSPLLDHDVAVGRQHQKNKNPRRGLFSDLDVSNDPMEEELTKRDFDNAMLRYQEIINGNPIFQAAIANTGAAIASKQEATDSDGDNAEEKTGSSIEPID